VTESLEVAAVEEGADEIERVDAIVIGAGVAGLYQLYRLREAGFSVRCFEEADGVGGTWYWNRYPGCAFDSPSFSYGYSFSDELIQEWDWKHHFSFQPDAERYVNFFADKFDLRRHVQFNSLVKAARWDEDGEFWEVELAGGQRTRATFLFPIIGTFAAGFRPDFPGAERFQGESYHSSRWPRHDPDLSDKRVAVIGTGATGIQLIPHIAKQAGHLTVFQRTPNYGVPADNGLIEPELQREFKENYSEIHKRSRENFGYRVAPDPRNARDVPKEDRIALYEEAWKRRGFEKFMVLFHDMFTDREILEEYSEFVRGKIRARIKDPWLAEKLVPSDHVIHAKRVPLETNYYETYERDNVQLVDLRETPIESFTEHGIRTSDREYEFDVIIYATGFDSVTGAFKRIDIRGVGGQSLSDKFADGVATYLGFTIAGFPNLFTHTLPAISNPGREWSYDWFTQTVKYMRDNGYTRIEATEDAEAAWGEHVAEVGRNAIFGDTEHSWYNGGNIPGKKRQLLLYLSPGTVWRDKCQEVSANGFEGFDLRRNSDGASPGSEAALESAVAVESDALPT
jgi:cation diffusion facilitator CzcD-associated flavoprotein CzcO